MRRRHVVVGMAIIAAIAIASPVFGISSSLKKAIKKEVAKQISSATGPQGVPGPQGPQGVQGPEGGQGGQGPSALRLDFDQPETDDTLRTLGTQNELTIKAECSTSSGAATVDIQFNSSVSGTSNAFTTNDTGGAVGVINETDALAPDTDTVILGLVSPSAGFRRGEMQIIYRNPGRVISVQLHAIADDTTGRCQVQGTAIPAS